MRWRCVGEPWHDAGGPSVQNLFLNIFRNFELDFAERWFGEVLFVVFLHRGESQDGTTSMAQDPYVIVGMVTMVGK